MRKKPKSYTNNDLDLELGRDFGLKSRVFFGLLTAAGLVFAVAGWAANAELSGAVLASGQIKVDKDLRTVQHLDGGIVREIAVRKGDVITADQLLFKLDDTQAKAELEIIRSQMTELASKRSRLVAEASDADQMEKADDKLGLGINKSEAMTGEVRLFKGNRKSRSNQVKQVELSMEQIDKEVQGSLSQIQANKRELKIVEAEYVKVKKLFDQGLIDGSRVYAVQRELTRLQGEQGNLEASIAKADSRRNELKVNLLQLTETSRNDAQKQLSEIEPRLAELEQRHGALTERMSRMEIRAPMAGTINELSVNTVGGVITPAQKLLTIVPENSKLQLEVRLQPQDIDQIFVGQPAKLRFTAFSARETPELSGKIVFVSPATTNDETTGQTFYVGLVELDAGESEKLNGKKLLPGMPVEAQVQTESRTALSYLAKPMVDQFERAFREQ
jgi:HlyD family type I secretion membrane fusion protein